MSSRNFLSHHKHILILALGIALYSAFFIYATFLRHDNFYSGRFDLGNMDQVVWNSLHGSLFMFTNPNGVLNTSRLGFHADYILVLLSPLYLIWSSPKMLLLVQTISLSLGALFIYLLSKNVLKNKMLALVFGLLYLLNPSVQYTNLYDFHAVTLATPFLLTAFYFMHKRNYIPSVLFLLLACLTKEQIWVVAAFFGAYMIFVQKQKKGGISIILFSLLMFYYLVWYAIPESRGGSHFALSYYSEFGESPTSILKNVLLSPINTISTALSGERLHYLFQLFMPLGFFSLLSPLFLVFASGDLGINLLSSNEQLHQLYYQYTAVITPFIFIAAVFGIQKILKRFPKFPSSAITLYLICSTAFVAYQDGPLPGAKKSVIEKLSIEKKFKNEIENYLYNIPSEKKVTTTNNIGSHVSEREFVYTIPLGLPEADVIIFDLDDPYSQPPPVVQHDMIENLQNSKSYELAFQKGNFYAFEKIQTQ